MLESQVPFARTIGAECGIENETIADIIQMGEAGHGVRILLGGRLLAEMLGDDLDFGDLQGRAVDGEQPKFMPPSNREVSIEESSQITIQMNKGLIPEFFSGVGKGAFSHGSNRHLRIGDIFEKGIQFRLEGRFQQIHNKENNRRKRKESMARKITKRSPILGNKVFGSDKFSQ
jgi:hypothetical protein